jgi:hypothetical protein
VGYWPVVTSQRAFWKWALLGGLTATVLLVAQANAVGGLSGLLQLGEVSAVRPLIESELGDVPLAPNTGHDGQIYYAIGLDLPGEDVPEVLDHGAYRYRRALYPAVASLFGLLDGEGLLIGMVVVTVAATAAATGLAAAIASDRGQSDWFALAVLLNPGMWLSVRLLTADVMAMGLMLLGLFGFLRRRKGWTLAFALSGLAKDVYLTTPAGLAVSRDRRRWVGIVVSGAVLASWMTFLTLTMGEGFTGRGNLAWPLMGIIEASSVWGNFDSGDLLYLIFALASVAAGLVYSIVVKSWLRWPILAWSVLGIVSSNWVWDLGNNAARAFAPIAVLIALGEANRSGELSPAAAGGLGVRTSG